MESKNYLLLFFKVIGMFLILYLFTYFLTYSAYYLASTNNKILNIKDENYELLLDILFIYLPATIFSLFSIAYVIKNKEQVFINSKGNLLKKVLVSISLIYFTSLLLDPFYHDFSSNNIPPIILKSVYFDRLFFEEVILGECKLNSVFTLPIYYVKRLLLLQHLHFTPFQYLSITV